MDGYYHWGPYLHSSSLRQDVCDDLLARGLRSGVDHSANLAGVLKREYLLAEEDRRHIEALLEDEFSNYARERSRYHGERPEPVSLPDGEAAESFPEPRPRNLDLAVLS